MLIPAKAKLALSIGLLAASFASGWSWRDAIADKDAARTEQEAAEAQTKASERLRKIEQLNAENAALVAQNAALRNQEREVITETITNEVIRYVQTPASTVCALDADGVRLHNAAAAGDVSGLSDTASGFNASAAELVTTVTANYGTCHAIRDQLINLQEWVRSQQ